MSILRRLQTGLYTCSTEVVRRGNFILWTSKCSFEFRYSMIFIIFQNNALAIMTRFSRETPDIAFYRVL